MTEDIKLICFDLDDTLIDRNSWKELDLAFGMSSEEAKMLYMLFKEGVLTYSQWAEITLKIFQKRGSATYGAINNIFTGYEYKPGVVETVAYLKNAGYRLGLISGSVDILVDKVAKDLGIEFAEANNILVFDEQDRLENIVFFGDDSLSKTRHLQSFCRKLGLKLSECACLGDGANDAEMFKVTGHGITFKGSPIQGSAWKVIDSIADLKTIF